MLTRPLPIHCIQLLANGGGSGDTGSGTVLPTGEDFLV
jgi:hypothetical protein